MNPMRPMTTSQVSQFQQRYAAKKRMLGVDTNIDIPDEVWSNDIYECYVYRGDKVPHQLPFEVIWLSIKRYDRKAIHDWRALQKIKSEVTSKHYDAVEMYPSESRVVDLANQYHLWVFTAPFPLGWEHGARGTPEMAKKIGATQR